MKWFEVAYRTSFERSDFLQAVLLEEGAEGVELDDPALLQAVQGRVMEADERLPNLVLPPQRRVVVKAYFQGDADFGARLARLRTRVGTEEAQAGVREVFEEDWASSWKQYFNPIRIGKRLLIVPSWKLEEVPAASLADAVTVILDPGMAFGTGNHPTTALCLQLLEEVVRPGDLVVDVGTGSGILAIAAAKLGAIVKAVDIDGVAVTVACANVRTNGVWNAVEVFNCDISDADQRAAHGLASARFELVVANIVPEVIAHLLPFLAALVAPGGCMILSGIVQGKMGIVEGVLHDLALVPRQIVADGEWRAILAGRAEHLA